MVRRFDDAYVKSQIKAAHALGPVAGVSKSFVIETSDQRKRLVLFLENRDLPIQVDVGPVEKQRSSEANNRLWKLHTLAGEVTGYTKDEMHEEALCKFFGYTEKKMLGGWIKRIPLKRSSTRNPKEFGQFMEATEIWYASEFGVWLDA
jgi:hypothetical protein